MGTPQLIMVILLAIGMTRGLLKHGESDGTVSLPGITIGTCITVGLLWWGGFWS